MSSENNDMKALADALWQYFLPKIRAAQTDSVRFFRAKVTDNPGNGQLTVQRPFEDGTLTLPCMDGVSGAVADQEVTVLVYGSMSNAVVAGNGTMKSFGGPTPTAFSDLEARVADLEERVTRLGG